jgi:hypothetical protein
LRPGVRESRKVAKSAKNAKPKSGVGLRLPPRSKIHQVYDLE